MFRIEKYEFEKFKYTPGHRANYAVLTKPGNREWGMKYSPQYDYSREHNVLKKFKHPQIPKRNDYGKALLYDGEKLVLGEHYIVIEHFEGEDIVEYYKKKGIPDANEMGKIAGYFSSISEPLEYLHSKGYVHTDIKPGHLILNPENGVMALIDLELTIKKGEILAGMTKEYASPEQKRMSEMLKNLPEDVSEKGILEHVKIDSRADLYSIGMILFEVLTGKLWLESNCPPIEINNAVPQKLNNIVLSLLEEDPANRMPSAQSLSDELANLIV